MNLFRNRFKRPRLDVELAFENVDGPERTHTRLVTFDRREKISTSFLDEIYEFFHVFLINEILKDNII